MELETDRLILREFTETDWPAVHAYAGNAETVEQMEFGPNTPSETKNFIQQAMVNSKQLPRTSYDLAVVVAKTDMLIGGVGLRVSNPQHQSGDFGYIFHPDYWGQGFASEAASAVVKFAFEQLGLHRIWATCRPANRASARVLEKVGLSYEGHLKGHRMIRGKWVDSLLYARIQS